MEPQGGKTDKKEEEPMTADSMAQALQRAEEQLALWKTAVEGRDVLLTTAYTEITQLKKWQAAVTGRDELLRQAYAEIKEKNQTITSLEGQLRETNKRIEGMGEPATVPVAPGATELSVVSPEDDAEAAAPTPTADPPSAPERD